MGCALGQGFHFARPLDPRDFEALLERTTTAAHPVTLRR
jgi:EAL domain-containing protein (putative c-di-GMP-specific phosphodiesterase class I)